MQPAPPHASSGLGIHLKVRIKVVVAKRAVRRSGRVVTRIGLIIEPLIGVAGVRSVRDFTAHASHELRTPVALIRSEAELALRFDRSPREYREAICLIGAEAQQMSSLLDSLLFLARIDAGTEHARLEEVDAQLLCARAFVKWRPVLREAGVHLTADTALLSVEGSGG